MKRTPLFPTSQNGRRIGAVLLAAAVLAGPLLAPPAGAVEPAPATSSTPAPAATPATKEPATPAVPHSATPVDPSTAAGKAAMAQAIGPGGAEMGQRSPRVTGGKAAAAATQSLTTQGTWTPSFGVQGLDVSAYQPNVNWQAQWNGGARFAYIKASEGNYYTNPSFSPQYEGSRSAGMVRGAYHFGIPNWSSGADQARYFVQHGGGWSADGATMPPVLDFEFNPYAGQTIGGFYFGNTCYGMSPGQLSSWVRDFGNTMRSLTGRLPVIYTNTSWWNQCLGNPSGFGDYPLWVASYPTAFTNNAGAIPTGSWSTYSIWQYSSTGPFAGDSNVWNGTFGDLVAFARNGVPNSAFQAMGNLAASTPSLGAQTSGIVCGLRDGGCFQGFAGGVAMWSPASGAQPSRPGAIRNAWAASGYENGVMGYPTSPEICGLKGGGCFQNYQHGAIMWSPGSGAAFSTFGAVRDFWQQQNFENGPLGYPTSDAPCGLRDGGCFQNYQGGTVMYSPAFGTFGISGAMLREWQQSGYENGSLGYPTSASICGLKNGGCFQNFEQASILSSPATGTHPVYAGPFQSVWAASGFENGSLGYPTSHRVCGLRNGGCFQNFVGGTVMYSPATGSQPITSLPVLAVWVKSGYENGSLGYPTSWIVCGLKNGGCFQNFEKGSVMWSQATGAQPMTLGPIQAAWGSQGFENGALGFPTGTQSCTPDGSSCTQTFQGGRLTWTSGAGIRKDPA